MKQAFTIASEIAEPYEERLIEAEARVKELESKYSDPHERICIMCGLKEECGLRDPSGTTLVCDFEPKTYEEQVELIRSAYHQNSILRAEVRELEEKISILENDLGYSETVVDSWERDGRE